MKIVTAFLCLLIVMISCRPAKKVQKIQEAISKVDTTPVIVIKDNKATDSARLIK